MIDPIAVLAASLVILSSVVQIHVGCFQKHRRYARDLSSPVNE